jgi:hypothetical protein
MLEISNADIGGIGPTDQLEVVQTSTDGPTMICEPPYVCTYADPEFSQVGSLFLYLNILLIPYSVSITLNVRINT